MWTRGELKDRAKELLKSNYWLALAVTMVVGIITRGGNIAELAYQESFSIEMAIILLFLFVVLSIIGLVFTIFAINPILVGKNRFFMESREKKSNFMVLFYSFKSGNQYINIVKTLFFQNLFIFLWLLLLIIPGIIKSYEYMFIPYILSENPEIDRKRAFEISKAMTDGHKLDILVLQISFLGWYLLGLLACCIGTVFVDPYAETTYAELYAVRREDVLRYGAADHTELPGFN